MVSLSLLRNIIDMALLFFYLVSTAIKFPEINTYKYYKTNTSGVFHKIVTPEFRGSEEMTFANLQIL